MRMTISELFSTDADVVSEWAEQASAGERKQATEFALPYLNRPEARARALFLIQCCASAVAFWGRNLTTEVLEGIGGMSELEEDEVLERAITALSAILNHTNEWYVHSAMLQGMSGKLLRRDFSGKYYEARVKSILSRIEKRMSCSPTEICARLSAEIGGVWEFTDPCYFRCGDLWFSAEKGGPFVNLSVRDDERLTQEEVEIASAAMRILREVVDGD